MNENDIEETDAEETEAREEEEEEARESNVKPEDVDFFSRVFEAGTTDGHGSAEPATPHEISEFEVPYELCGKHLKSGKQDFMVQIKSLTPRQEANISKTVESGPQMSMAFARESVVAVNGAPLKRHEKEWFWSHLGTAGRQLVIAMYAEAFMAAPKAFKRAKVSRRR